MVEEEKFVNETFMGFALSFTGMVSVQRKPCMVYGKGFSYNHARFTERSNGRYYIEIETSIF